MVELIHGRASRKMHTSIRECGEDEAGRRKNEEITSDGKMQSTPRGGCDADKRSRRSKRKEQDEGGKRREKGGERGEADEV